MKKRSFLSVGTWVGLVSILWILGWIIAESIPVFNNLLSLIVRPTTCFCGDDTDFGIRLPSSLVGLLVRTSLPFDKIYHTVLTELDGLGGVFWLYLNYDRLFSSPRKIFLTIVNVIIFGIGACLVCSPCRLSLCIPRWEETNI